MVACSYPKVDIHMARSYVSSSLQSSIHSMNNIQQFLVLNPYENCSEFSLQLSNSILFLCVVDYIRFVCHWDVYN